MISLKELHSWALTPKEAIQLQVKLASRVIKEGKIDNLELVAGVDLSSPNSRGMVTGAVVVLSYPGMKVLEVATATDKPYMPYIPGLLSFRESPVILQAWQKLKTAPDLLIVDGQGIAHPRRLGIASHLGLWLNIPAIGCAKSILVGRYTSLPDRAGAVVPLKDRDEVIGGVIRTRKGHPPLYISVGHRISLEEALYWVRNLSQKDRLPEPIKMAHMAAKGLF